MFTKYHQHYVFCQVKNYPAETVTLINILSVHVVLIDRSLYAGFKIIYPAKYREQWYVNSRLWCPVKESPASLVFVFNCVDVQTLAGALDPPLDPPAPPPFGVHERWCTGSLSGANLRAQFSHGSNWALAFSHAISFISCLKQQNIHCLVFSNILCVQYYIMLIHSFYVLMQTTKRHPGNESPPLNYRT